MKQILVLKIGSSTLTNGTNNISRDKLADIMRQVSELQKDYHVIIVSSGAVAAAKQYITESSIPSKQALAAIGQPKLMRMYDEVSVELGITVAQCLLSHRDLSEEGSKQHTKNTIQTLLKHDVVPIINENDTTAIDEFIIGDNDTLSALVAVTIGADILVIASDINGLYDKNPHVHSDAVLIRVVTDLASVSQYIEEVASTHGTGGMTTKFDAAEICMKQGIVMKIVGGGVKNFLLDTLADDTACTTFYPKQANH